MDVRAWRARVLAWSGRLPEAEKESLEILKVSRTEPDNWMGLASVYLREGKLSDAEGAISSAEELDPKRPDIHAARARILRAGVARMHRHLREKEADYEIRFVPDPMCWTEVPSDFRSLARQRARWQKGLLDVLWPNRDMLFRPRYGRIGSFALPYLWLFELFAPIMEVAGIATIVLAASLGILSREFFLQFLIFGYAFATVISIGSVLQEEVTYKRYNDWKDVVRLVSYSFLEHFPLPATAHDLAAAGPVAVFARRP